jgi:predicted MFS family arabinose efflux permease
VHQNFLNNQKKNEQKIWKRRDILKDTKFYCYLPSTLLMSFAVTGFFFHQVYIAPLKGWDLNLIAIGLIFYAIFSIIGSTIAGLLVDKFNARKIMPFFLIPYLLILIILMYLNGPLILFAYMSVVGLTQAIGENVSGSLWAEMYGVNNLGSIKALMTFFGILASAASPFLFGIILDQGDTLNMLILGTIILIIIFSVLSYIGKYFK